MTICNALNLQLFGSTGTGTFVGSAGATLSNPTLTSATLVTSALGTPTSGVLTNCTNLPVGTGISGLGTGIATFLATPTSANLLAAITNPSGTGLLVFNTSPTFITPALGTPSSGNLSNCTGIPSGGITGIIPTANGGTGTGTTFTTGSVIFAGASGIYSQDNANFIWDDTNDRLGLGLTGPSCKLQMYFPVDSSISGISNLFAVFQNSNSVTGQGAGVGFAISGTSGAITAKIVALRSGASADGHLTFFTKSDGISGDGGTEKMRITNLGSVLVGETTLVSTGSKFEVKGNTSIAGATSGAIAFAVPAIAGTNTVTWPAGTTDFSSTGGTSQVIKQVSAGAAFTVGQLAASDMSNGTTGTGAVVLAGGTPTFTGTPNIAAATGTSLALSATAGLTINGLRPFARVKTQLFTSSGTYTPSTGMLFAWVECIAAGGGSGGCGVTGVGTASNAGSGGGGAVSLALLSAATVGASQTVTIGAGGTAGASGANAGGTGGTSSLGALVVSVGGGAGSGDSAAGTPKIGASSGAGGASASGTGDITIAGGNGGIGAASAPNAQFGSQAGGNSFAPSLSPIAGNPVAAAGAANTGQGATGGTLGASAAASAGAVGGSGRITIIEYCNQ